MNHEALFYIAAPEAESGKAGPYDLVQMAGLLRKKIISAETPTLEQGQQDWLPFGYRIQFSLAREMPADAVSTRVVELDQEAREPKSVIPLPSAETMLKLGGLFAGALVAAGVGFLIGWLDATAGYCLAAIGGAVAVAAMCLMAVRFLDEDSWTMTKVIFVPGYEFFYFVSNFWQYFPLVCARYLGGALCAGALAGLAVSHLH